VKKVLVRVTQLREEEVLAEELDYLEQARAL